MATALTEQDVAADTALPIPSGQVPEWVMIARTGRWAGHPAGTETVTPDHLHSALQYFERHYRANGADLPVDYHHASVFAAQGRVQKAPAAGWIREMQLRNGDAELWGRVLWTADAARAIARQEFRYLSPVLRFAVLDRITGQPVPMALHSVALTNTPFLTELPALNEQAATDMSSAAAHGTVPVSEGGRIMPLLAQMAAVLGKPEEQLRCDLGLESADDVHVAHRFVACAARARELDAGAGALFANAPAMKGVRERLGLPPNAAADAVLNAVDALCAEREGRQAADLVDQAVETGRIPPSQRAFFLDSARRDLEAARQCLHSLPPMVAPVSAPSSLPSGGLPRELTDVERSICRQLGLSPASFLQTLS